MKDRIWKPLYAIWNNAAGNNSWVRSAGNNICTFDTIKEAEKFIKTQLSHPAVIKIFIPYLGWPGYAPKKMGEVQEITNYWQYHHPGGKNGS